MGLLETVNGAFSDVGISQWKEKLVGMGSDGASVNIGKKGGGLLCYDAKYRM